MTVAVGIVVPLISAVLAGVVAWIVAGRTAQSAREHWVLDKRHAAYAALLDAANDVFAGITGPDQKRDAFDTTKRRAFMHALQRLDLVAPQRVLVASEAVRDAIPRHPQPDLAVAERNWNALREQVNQLVILLRDDLLPAALK